MCVFHGRDPLVQFQICGHSIDLSCPICKTPDLLKDTTESLNYISWLKNCLDGLLSDKMFGQFEELLDDRNLIINPNYARCPNVMIGVFCLPSVTG